MTFRRLVVAFTFLAIFAMAMRISVVSDTWWHLRAGAWIVENRQILRTDPFSLTRAGQPWVYPGWLAQVVLYSVYRVWGNSGLNLLTALLATLAFIPVWLISRGRPLLRSFVWILSAAAASVFWSARPQMVSFTLAGVTLWLVETGRAGHGKRLWLVPPLVALWANMHGGFAIAFLILLAYIGGELLRGIGSLARQEGPAGRIWSARWRELKPLLLIFVVSVGAISLNPHGPQMILYPFKTVSIEVLRAHIQEWQSPDFHQPQVLPFLFMILLLVAAYGTSRRVVSTEELLLVSGFLALALTAGRNIAIFALLSAPSIAAHLDAAFAPSASVRWGGEVPPRLARRLNWVLLLLFVVAAGAKAAIPLSQAANLRALEERFPMGAIAYIRQQEPPGPLFNSYNWGSLILWELYPRYPSFVDGRTDLFDDEVLQEYLDAWRGDPSWEDLFRAWGIRLALVEPQAPIRWQLLRAGWNQVYEDEQAAVLQLADR